MSDVIDAAIKVMDKAQNEVLDEVLELRKQLAAAEDLARALEGAEATVGVFFGDAEGVVPEYKLTPLGVPVKVGEVMKEIRAALSAWRKARGE